jgi:hypothetical protein
VLPLRDSVRKKETVEIDDVVSVDLTVLGR